MVFGTGTFGYRESDLDLFFSTYSQTSSTKDISFDESNQWQGETGKNFVEGELDVSYIAAMGPNIHTLVANSNISASTEAGEGYGPALLAFLVDLNSREEVPNVLSMSLDRSLTHLVTERARRWRTKRAQHIQNAGTTCSTISGLHVFK